MKRILNWLTGRRLAVVLIGAPLVAAALYLWLMAANRFVSESVVAVKQSGEQVPALEGLSSILQASAGGTRGDTLLLRSHLLSLDMLKAVDAQLKLRIAYASPKTDLLYRLPADATQDRFLTYYRDRVEVLFDDESGLLTIRAQGFDPLIAQQLNQALVKESERFINEISQRMAQDQMRFASGELEQGRERLAEAKAKLVSFQEKHKVLDPMLQAQASSTLTAELQGRLSRLEVELKGYQAFMDNNSFQVRSLRDQIDATRRQIEEEGARGTSETRDAKRLNTLSGEFQALQTELQFAEEAFKASALSYQTARVESARKVKSLVLVESPTLPEEAEYPKRGYNLLSLALGLVLLFGIVRLMIATIEDHLD